MRTGIALQRIGEQINTGIELEITALGERSMTGYGGLMKQINKNPAIVQKMIFQGKA